MIFSPIRKLSSKADRSFCFELIDVYCRHVEVYCQVNKIKIPSVSLSNEIVSELRLLGIVEQDSDVVDLQKELKGGFSRLINAINIVLAYPTLRTNELKKLYNSERKKLQANWQEKPLRIVDFFCGAGGLSLGFIQEGFTVALANDIEDVCIQTYKYNHPELPSQYVVQGDIRQIVDNIEGYIQGDIDVVIGGPPCQGFSEANRQRVIDDPRNKLYKYYLKAVEKIAPKFVVMENVKGMLKVAHQVVEDYEALRINKNGTEYTYKVFYEVLNSQCFSVAQSRERLIYIAIRSDVMQEKKVSPEVIFAEIKKSCNANTVYTLQSVLDDIKPLDAPRIKNCNEIDSEITGKKIDLNEHAGNNNPYLALINKGRVISYLYNHKARYCSDVNYEIYRRLNSGDDATDEKIKDIMPYAHRNHCFKDKYFKLYADRPCRTITAHLRMDCHSHIHPYQVRSLTPREAARAQSFPDDYLFLGAYLKTYMQIGNAVPPMMANGIAKIIKKYLV